MDLYHHLLVSWTSQNRIFEENHFRDCSHLMCLNRLIGSQWACWDLSYDGGHRTYDVCNYCGEYYAIYCLRMHHFELLTRHNAPNGLILMTCPLRFAFLKLFLKIQKKKFFQNFFFTFITNLLEDTKRIFWLPRLVWKISHQLFKWYFFRKNTLKHRFFQKWLPKNRKKNRKKFFKLFFFDLFWLIILVEFQVNYKRWRSY